MVRRVPRLDCGAGRTDSLRLAPAPHVVESWNGGEQNDPTSCVRDPAISALVPLVEGRHTVLLSSRVGG